ncbi:MAG TPA: APC family permease [Pirellulales bacterium]|nr:APC family permease [Pirellulales bacterium]
MPASASDSSDARQPHFQRTLGLWPAVAVNMTQMCGIGPFITIPLVVAAMGGAQAILAWVLGAVIVLADGLVWAELGAAMPGAGGTYLYLREAFQYRTGRLMPFLFIWTAILAIPLIMSTGVIGLLKYIAYYGPVLVHSNAIANADVDSSWSLIALTPTGIVAAFGIVLIVVIALYRKNSSVEKLAIALWIVMFVSIAGVMAASFSHFDVRQAFHFPPGAFRMDRAFFLGLGAALVLSVYDYLGYNTTAYMGSELRDPGRVIPRSITYSILGMMVIYLVMNIGILGALPVDQIKNSDFFASIVIEQNWGKLAAKILTGLIVVTALASIFTGLLGGSRVPFNAARDKLFLPVFGRLHPRLNIPHVAILVMGLITALGSLFKLDAVINMLTAVTVLVQGIAQIAALSVLRYRQPELKRPYRMFCYPLPSIIALVGWIYIYVAAGWPMLLDPQSVEKLHGAEYWQAVLLAPGPLSLAWLLLGVIAFLTWARIEKTWPFGPKEIRHDFA